MILRHCTNTSLSYFLRTMDPEATAAAAALHDQLVGDALHRLLHMHLATPRQREHAVQQAQLPVKF